MLLPGQHLLPRVVHQLPALGITGQAAQLFAAARAQQEIFAQQQGHPAVELAVQLGKVLQHAHGHLDGSDLLGAMLAFGQQRGNGAHADAAAGQAQASLAAGAAQRLLHHGAPADLQVAEVFGLVYPQQHLDVRRQMHVQAKRLVRLQVAPAWRQAGVKLAANAGQTFQVARRQGVGLAHQFGDPGVGGNGFGE